ncbi:hypothetical protein KPATCC21470_1682 [Kitasatospora purpeofusca]
MGVRARVPEPSHAVMARSTGWTRGTGGWQVPSSAIRVLQGAFGARELTVEKASGQVGVLGEVETGGR